MKPPRTSAAPRPASSSLNFHGTAEQSAVVKKAMDTITLLMAGGAEYLRPLRAHLSTLPENQQVRMLGTPDSFGHLPLYAAMEEGQAEAVKAYGELLEVIPKDKRFELLAAKFEDDSALYNAMSLGKHEVIKAYGEVLASLYCESQHGKRQRIDTSSASTREMQELCDLLAGKNRFGDSALYTAMSSGEAEAVKEYGDLLKLAPPEKRFDLLLPRNEKNESGLAIALRRNKFDAVTQYLGIVEKHASDLPSDDIESLQDELQYCRDHILSGSLLISAPDQYKKMYEQLSNTCGILLDLLES